MSQEGLNKSSSLTKTWTYVPGRKFDLKPFNIEEMRKQILEGDDTDEEEDDDVSDNEESHAVSESENRVNCKATDLLKDYSTNQCDHLNGNNIVKSCKTPLPLHRSQEMLNDAHSKKSSFLVPVVEEPNDDSVFLNDNHNDTLLADNKENIACNMEPINISAKDPKRSDSFDLGISVLSLNTPVKKKENYLNFTPKINIIPSSECKMQIHKYGSSSKFMTPNVTKTQFSLNKPLFKTPVNKPLANVLFNSAQKQIPGTPYQQSIKKVVPIQYSSSKNNKVLNSIEQDFGKIVVNNVEYIIMNMLGRGGSSEVYDCFNQEEKIHVAIKIVTLTDASSAESYINEVKLLEALQSCDRIIKMYDYEIQEQQLLVVLEKGGDDLSTIIKHLATKQSHLPTYMLLFYWLEMLHAVKQIHANGVIHSDLKPANFLRSEGGLKLIDFGIASKVQDDMTCVYKSHQEGSCNYISPEALTGGKINGNVDSPNFGLQKFKIHFKSDVWSLGCILYQLVYRKTPFQQINPIYLKLATITDPNHKIHYDKADWVSPRFINTIKKCLQYDVRSRPSVDELIYEYEEMLKKI